MTALITDDMKQFHEKNDAHMTTVLTIEKSRQTKRQVSDEGEISVCTIIAQHHL